MVLFEFNRYVKNNPNTKNALTIGLFVGIIAVLGLTTLPELVKRVKTTDFDLESFEIVNGKNLENSVLDRDILFSTKID